MVNEVWGKAMAKHETQEERLISLRQQLEPKMTYQLLLMTLLRCW